MKEETSTIEPILNYLKTNQKYLNLIGAFRYLIKKAFLILLTIFIGTFITIIITNRPVVVGMATINPQLDTTILSNINKSVGFYQQDNPHLRSLSFEDRQTRLDEYRAELIEDSGINKPYIEKHLSWTLNALKFNWGKISITDARPQGWWASGRTRFSLNEIILQYLPMTLLLVGSSYFLLFLLGLPLALYLSQNTHKWYDRFITWIAPLSSVPSWVIGILLILVFAVELRWLPAFGIFDTLPPETSWGYIPIILKHMVLPVTAIFLSLFFQLVYSWRTVFVTFSNEDYVDLGKAIGLKPRRLRKEFILKPTLPFVITNFSLLLISFWQMTMALEVIFRWEGIGWLFVNLGLPNFWGEGMYPGDIIIAISLIVLFAYLLGITVFVLDIVYVIVDPRIRLVNNEKTLHSLRKTSWLSLKKQKSEYTNETKSTLDIENVPIQHNSSIQEKLTAFRQDMQTTMTNINRFWLEFRRYPSAMLGLSIIIFLIFGSIYAFVALPYREIGSLWGASTLTGRTDVPKLARPNWFNAFRISKMLSTFSMDDEHENVVIQERPLSNGGKQKSIIYLFDYHYADFPSEMNMYLNGTFEEKTPFVSMKWITPDGREFNLPGLSTGSERTYNFTDNIPARRLVSENKNWEEWFNFSNVNATPYYYLLLADPDANTPQVMNGLYQLRITGITFEEYSDIETEFVMLGQVYGVAGTDNLRRDLSVPLFWGMPFALVIGLFGSLITTIFSMILAATGVWFGGWTDDLIQRLTEVNLVLPILMISVLAYAYLGISIWTIFIIVILLNVFGAPLKSFRSVLLQVRESPYIEAAKAYGASSKRIIMKYMVPRIIPVLVPQLIILIPSFVFLEATLGLFNISTGLPTWGTVIYQAATKGALYGSRYWVLGPIILLLLSGFAFSLCGSALEKILNPRLLDE
ncbi:MAG TPA: ABC transporter permease subunit [Anaerolineaceae bacterium]|nr:ABC transporter permease subunit [Anaerolineaceae bacterium]